MNRPCRHPGCPAIVPRGMRYCSTHQAKGEQQHSEAVRQYDAQRDPRAVAFYRSKAWLAMRLVVLREQPVCADCRTRFSHHVDHITPLLTVWSRRLDRSNLRGLCAHCHSIKTAAERAAGARRGTATGHGSPRVANAPRDATEQPAGQPTFLG